MLKNNMEKLSPLLLVFLLIGSIIGIGLSYTNANPQLNELKNQLEDQNSIISNIEKEKEIDKNKISAMEREIIVLNDKISSNKIDIIEVETKISQKDENLNEINNLWETWEEHKELSPKNNFGYRYNDPGGGSCLGNCMVSIQSLIIPFKDVKDCMIWARFNGTGSMRPVIYKDTITIGIKSKCLDPSEINKGDIVEIESITGNDDSSDQEIKLVGYFLEIWTKREEQEPALNVIINLKKYLPQQRLIKLIIQ